MSKKLRKIVRWGIGCLIGLVGLALVLAASAWFALRGSLAHLNGQLRLPSLAGPVQVERDALGVPTIRATNRRDVSRATGFLHAQERFFQMDLLRRNAAGELAELFGSPLVPADRAQRRHRLRAVACRVVDQLPSEHRALLEAYVEGVNAGLNALWVRPPEYLLLRARPEPWRAEDTVLAVYAMYFTLQDSEGGNETCFQAIEQALPPSAARFFSPSGTEWDAALDDSSVPLPPLPGPDILCLTNRASTATVSPASERIEDEGIHLGSNNWAVDGRMSRTGAAIVADDMHLFLGLPNIWYRARLCWTDPSAPAATNEVIGVTLPGTPAVVVGSNRHVAWAFTNSDVDTTDTIWLEFAPENARRYRTPDGWKELETVEEVIRVRGRTNDVLRFETTIWGPLMTTPESLPRRALRWVAHLPEATNLRLLDLEHVRDTESALHLANTCGIPAQNFVAGDRLGRIGWTLMGRLPRRVGFDGRLPASWADGRCRWDGLLPPEEYPRVVSPPQGCLWTANNRVSGSPEYRRLGPWTADVGARARQIRDGLLALQPGTATERDLLNIQLDDRALFLERWQKRLERVLESPPLDERRDLDELRGLVECWGARAAVDSAGFRLVREFRFRVARLLFEPVEERCRAAVPDFGVWWCQQEGPLWALLEQRPLHLLNPRFADYEALLAAAVDQMVSDYRSRGIALSQATWGQRNQVHVQHPISRAVPPLSRWLDIPPTPLPGDNNMPRVQAPRDGASERMVVSPGHEENGLFHMPGGQSGHFLSPFYRAGHQAWSKGEPTPFLPGPAVYRLSLRL